MLLHLTMDFKYVQMIFFYGFNKYSYLKPKWVIKDTIKEI
jgi:hypothetical protein